jgi:single-strand DNA-binding protein
MNSIVLMGEVLSEPELRYTPDNLAVTSLVIGFPSLRPDEPPYRVRVSSLENWPKGWWTPAMWATKSQWKANCT